MRPGLLFLVMGLLALPTDGGVERGGRLGELPPGELGQPDYLSELARATLQRRMARHGRDLSVLVQAVVLLRRPIVAELAANIANEPRIGRPLPDGDEELNAVLPERFFVLQDELRDRAKSVAEAARRRDDAKLATAFGLLAQSCVACHSAYLEPRTPPTPPKRGK